MASNVQAGTRGLSASDWIRIKRLRGSRNFQSDKNGDIVNPYPNMLETTKGARRVFTEFGTSKIRRPASFWTDYRASQTADYVLERQDTQTKSRDLNINTFCRCLTTYTARFHGASNYLIRIPNQNVSLLVGTKIVFFNTSGGNIKGDIIYSLFEDSSFDGPDTAISVSQPENPSSQLDVSGVDFSDAYFMLLGDTYRLSAIKHNGPCIKCINS